MFKIKKLKIGKLDHPDVAKLYRPLKAENFLWLVLERSSKREVIKW